MCGASCFPPSLYFEGVQGSRQLGVDVDERVDGWQLPGGHGLCVPLAVAGSFGDLFCCFRSCTVFSASFHRVEGPLASVFAVFHGLVGDCLAFVLCVISWWIGFACHACLPVRLSFRTSVCLSVWLLACLVDSLLCMLAVASVIP